MNRDDAFLTELQVNDKVKVTVNFFGQEMPFEGTCTGKTDDKISILTNAKPEPVELPLSAIIEGSITGKNKINIEESADDNTFENIEIKHPEVIYGYYITDLNNEAQSGNYANNPNEFTLSNIITAIILAYREFTSNIIIKNLYNNSAFDLNNVETFSSFYKNNKSQNDDVKELYNQYISSLEIFINKDITHNDKSLTYYLKHYLSDLSYLSKHCYHFSYDSEEEKSDINDRYFILIIELFKIIWLYTFVHDSKQKENFKQYVNTFHNFLFIKNIILKSFFKTTFYKIIDKFEQQPEIPHQLIILLTLIKDMAFLEKTDKNLSELIEAWYEEQITKHNLFNPNLLIDNTADIVSNNHVLIPITSFDDLTQSTKYILIKFMYSLYANEVGLLYLSVSNKELHKRLTNYIKSKFNLDEDLDSSVKTIFSHFTKIVNCFFFNILEVCNALVNIISYDKENKKSYSIINEKTNSIIHLLEHEADKYITVTTKFNNRLRLFFKRLASISSPINKLDFLKAEEQLLLSYQNCSDLIEASNEEIFSESIELYLSLINKITHLKKITIYFYSKFITIINISVIKQAISFNTDLGRIFIPLEISSSKHVQTSYITKIRIQSSLSDKTNNDIKTNVKLLPDDRVFYIAEISFTDFGSVLNNGFDIDITLEYKFKTAWDFEKCETTWETREISESFFIQDELKHLAEFHEIRNLFRDYSSGSVIKDDRMFFGREQDIKHVIENIRDESGRIVTNRCVCIYGQTRTGKSSLLYHIKKGLQSSPSNIVVDIGDIGSSGASEAGIKYRILSCLLEEIELEHDDLCTLLTDSGISMTADQERNKTDDSYFTEQIGKIRSILRRKAKDVQIIILIDEFTYIYDWIKENKLSETFMKFWKAFITNYDICAIIVGQDHMMKFINDQRFTNAFGAIRTWEVNYLREPDACKLVTMPISDSPDYAGQNGCAILPEAVNMLVEMTSGSAYLLMNICADFVDYLNERHALTATGGHAEDFLRRNLSKFEERWFEPLFNDKSELDSDASITANKELLKKLALSYSEHSGVLPDELSLTDQEKERLQSLEARRVLEMNDGRWRITVRLYAEWLRNKFGSR